MHSQHALDSGSFATLRFQCDFDAPEPGLKTAGGNPQGESVYNISENGIEKMLEPGSLADRTRGALYTLAHRAYQFRTVNLTPPRSRLAALRA